MDCAPGLAAAPPSTMDDAAPPSTIMDAGSLGGYTCSVPTAALAQPPGDGAATTTAQGDHASQKRFAEPADAPAHSLHVIEVAWSHLCSRARLAIRTCCREGRLLHDRLWTHVNIVLAARGKGVASAGPDQEQQQVKEEGSEQEKQRQESLLHDTRGKDPVQLAQELGAAVGRGARPRSLAVHFGTKKGVAEECLREQQLLSVLSCCAPRCGSGLTHLELSGCPPLTPAVAQAVAEVAPGLTSLTISLSSAVEPADPVHLLAACGGGLQRLRLLRVGAWSPELSAALEACGRLTELQVAIERSKGLRSMEEEATVLASICNLRHLQALSLHYYGPGSGISPTALQQHANGLQRLGALTALRRLRLSLPSRYRTDVSPLGLKQLEAQGQHVSAACRAAWDSQQAAFAAALRCMPHLQSLTYDAGFLGAKDLAGCTALTQLHTLGLLLPQPSPPVAAAAGNTGPNASASAKRLQLPPQLQQLRLRDGVSPQVLVAAARPQALRRVSFGHAGDARLAWRVGDAVLQREGTQDPVYRLRAEAAACMGEAATLLARTLEPRVNLPHLIDKGMCGRSLTLSAELLHPLSPPEGQPDGHAVWIRQLGPLGDTQALRVTMLNLGSGDLEAIGRIFPHLLGLDLSQCYFPIAALPCLAPLPCLRALRIQPANCLGAREQETLVNVLLNTCTQLPQLQRLVLQKGSMSARNELRPVGQRVKRLLGPRGKEIKLSIEK